MKKLIILISIFIIHQCIYANPQLANVAKGNVSLQSQNNTLTITAPDKAIINWHDFSINAQEITKFIQPSSTSCVLNRVIGKNISSLLGLLEANGKILLINPNGIIIGEKGRINTASFLASTFDILDKDFLHQNEILFKGDNKASIVNLGSVTAINGDVIFIAYKIDNKGTVQAPLGEVNMAAGMQVLLNSTKDSKVFVKVNSSSDENSEETGINNQGLIEGIKVRLEADGNIFSHAINHEGIINAEGLEEKNGEVFLVAKEGINNINGKIAAKNEKTGGTVHLLGEKVGLFEKAEIDVSAEGNAGEVLIGGDFQGQNPSITNAKRTYVHEDAIIKANAKTKGDGGKVIAWADEVCRFYGSVEAKGGEEQGNGGFVEISGKKQLDFHGTADRRAKNGKDGVLYLDPEVDILIKQDGTATTGGVFIGAGPYFFDPSAVVGPHEINFPDIDAQLGLGDVVIQTSWPSTMDVGNGTITIEKPTASGSNENLYNRPNNLTLIANGRDPVTSDAIIFKGRIVNIHASSGDITLQAPNGNIIAIGDASGYNVGATATRGELTIDCGRDIIMQQGNYVAMSLEGKSEFGGRHFNITAGRDISLLSALPGSTTPIATGTIIGGLSPSGGISRLTAGRDITVESTAVATLNSQTAIYTTQSQLSVIAGRDIKITGFLTSNKARIYSLEHMHIEAGRNIDLYQHGHINLYSIIPTFDQNLTVIAGQDIWLHNESLITNHSTNGEINIVADNLYPTSPMVGPGVIKIDPFAEIHTNTPTDPLRIFTGLQLGTTIEGTLNGVTHTPGAYGVDTINERWGIWYPNSYFGGSYYTIFYKLDQSIGFPYPRIAFYEIFRDLHPFNEYICDSIRFDIKYLSSPKKHKKTVHSPSFEDGYFIRRRAYERNKNVIFSVQADN